MWRIPSLTRRVIIDGFEMRFRIATWAMPTVYNLPTRRLQSRHHLAIQAGLGQTHNVVAWHGSLRTDIGKSQNGSVSALHHIAAGLRERSQTV